jgi:hypothetical protein
MASKGWTWTSQRCGRYKYQTTAPSDPGVQLCHPAINGVGDQLQDRAVLGVQTRLLPVRFDTASSSASNSRNRWRASDECLMP